MSSELTTRLRLKNDFEFYARHALKVKPKRGALLPLVLNRAQRHVHEQIEKQLVAQGFVRALVLKGRQQGVSTYVEARGYWKVTHSKGMSAFILTHEQRATDSIFKMVARYHNNCPDEIRPETGKSSAKELYFGKLDSGYGVGTAGTKDVGRGGTLNFFHGSEVSSWQNAAEHASGIMQSIPDTDTDTDGLKSEVILESTAKGVGNFFHVQWKEAEAGNSDYIAIFVPWFWQDEYRRKVPDDFSLTDEEIELKRQYKLDDRQMVWRRAKIIELSADGVNGERMFRQEYPMNAAEAFQTSGIDSLITPEMVLRARKNDIGEAYGAVIAGVDPSHGGDRFSLVCRQGRRLHSEESHVKDAVDTLQKRVAKCVNYMKEHRPDMMFIDQGFGADIVDYMRYNLGYENVKAIAFGSTPHDERRFKNKRAEMFGRMADWLNDENNPASIPDSDELQADLCACPYKVDLDNKITILPKEKIKSDFGFSPDLADAAALTFAETVDFDHEDYDDYEDEHNAGRNEDTGY